jgi:hypothetical protein
MKAHLLISLALLLVGCAGLPPRAQTMTAEQARILARQLANDEARALCGFQPFQNGAQPLFADGRWTWRDRRACGSTDVEATVTFAANGSAPSVEVLFLDNRANNFFRY